MACATAWMSALLSRMAERPGRERLINVADESWKIIQHTGLGEWFQSNFKLARQFGVMNLVVLHKLGDLQAAGDAGSRAARIAEGLIADASTRIVYHQDESQIPMTRELLGLSQTEARLLTMLSSGQALWRVGSRSFVVQHYRSRFEARLTDTDTGMRIDTGARADRDPGEPARAGAGGDAALLAVIGGLGTVVLLTWAWGGLAGALFGQGWPTVSVGGLLGVVLRLPEHLADPSTAWPGVRARRCPVRPLSTGCSRRCCCSRLRSRAWRGGSPPRGPDATIRARTERGGHPPASSGCCAHRGAGARTMAVGGWRSDATGGRVLYAERRHALVAFGPPQSGKSAGPGDPGAARMGRTRDRLLDQDRPARRDPGPAQRAR